MTFDYKPIRCVCTRCGGRQRSTAQTDDRKSAAVTRAFRYNDAIIISGVREDELRRIALHLHVYMRLREAEPEYWKRRSPSSVDDDVVIEGTWFLE